MHSQIGLPREVADWEKFTPAEVTAQRIARAIEGNRRSVTMGMGNRMVSTAGRLLARPLEAWMRRRERRCNA